NPLDARLIAQAGEDMQLPCRVCSKKLQCGNVWHVTHAPMHPPKPADGNAAGAKCGCKSARPVIFSLRPALSMPTTRGLLRRKLGPITFAARHERKEG